MRLPKRSKVSAVFGSRLTGISRGFLSPIALSDSFGQLYLSDDYTKSPVFMRSNAFSDLWPPGALPRRFQAGPCRSLTHNGSLISSHFAIIKNLLGKLHDFSLKLPAQQQVASGGSAIARLAAHPNTDRNRLKRIEPLWPVSALTPGSRCPHGVTIRIGRVCGVCHAAGRSTQVNIDKMPAPPPVDPEVRALERIAFFRDWLASHPGATTRMRVHILRQIIALEGIVREYIPTRYLPAALKGGKG